MYVFGHRKSDKVSFVPFVFIITLNVFYQYHPIFVYHNTIHIKIIFLCKIIILNTIYSTKLVIFNSIFNLIIQITIFIQCCKNIYFLILALHQLYYVLCIGTYCFCIIPWILNTGNTFDHYAKHCWIISIYTISVSI